MQKINQDVINPLDIEAVIGSDILDVEETSREEYYPETQPETADDRHANIEDPSPHHMSEKDINDPSWILTESQHHNNRKMQ